jgi:hypothetical protein
LPQGGLLKPRSRSGGALWIILAIVTAIFAAAFTRTRIEPHLPAMAEGLRQRLIEGVKLARLTFLAISCFSIANFFLWRRLYAASQLNRPPRNFSFTNRDWIAASGLFLAALLLRLPSLNQSLWWDELNTYVRVVQRGIPVIFAFSADGNNHLLNSLLMFVSAKLIGAQEWELRLPSLLLGCAAPPAIYLCGTLALPRRITVLMAALAVIHFRCVSYADEARGYAGAFTFGLIACFLICAVWREFDARVAAAFVIASSAACGFLLPMLVLPIAHATAAAVWFLFARFSRAPRQDTAASLRGFLIAVWGALGGLLIGALAIPQVMEYSRRSRVDMLPLQDLYLPLLNFAAGGPEVLLSAVISAAALLGLYSARKNLSLIAAIASPAALELAAFLLTGQETAPRILLPVIFPFLLGLALFLARNWPANSLRRAAAAIIATAFLINSGFAYWPYWTIGNPPLRETASLVGSRSIFLTGPQSDLNTYYFRSGVVRSNENVSELLDDSPEFVLDGIDCAAASNGAPAPNYREAARLDDWTFRFEPPTDRRPCFVLWRRTAASNSGVPRP